MTRLDGVRSSIVIALADITYAFGMRARTSRLPCSYQLAAREPTLNAFILEVAAAEATGLAKAADRYWCSMQRDFGAQGDRSPYWRSVNKPIGLDS